MSEQSRYTYYINSILPGMAEYSFEDKERCISAHLAYMLDRLQSMFKWEGLPDTIPERSLELYLMINGNVCIAKDQEGELYAFTGGLGGPPDPYYMPTKYVVTNPALKLSKTYDIGTDCVVIPNDSMYIGMMPLLKRYATALAENELSINIGSINTRVIDIISAPDDRSKASAEKYLEDVRAGKLGVIGENAFLEGIRVTPSGSGGTRNSLTSLIELEQYLKGGWFQEIGLMASFNMKREALNSAESEIDNDSLLPLIDNMLDMRRKGADKINEMFGTDISVDFSSSWKDNIEEIEAVQEKLENEADIDEPQEAVTDEIPEDPEETEEPEEPEEPEETSIEEIKEDVEEIKGDIEEIKEELEVTESDQTE